MVDVFKLFGTIAVDTKDAESDLDDVKGAGERSADGIGNAFKKIGGIVAAAFAVDKIIEFGKKTIEAAADAQAAGAQFSQVFGDMEGDAKAAVDRMAESFGMVDTRISPIYTRMASKFKGLGLETEEAMKKAEQATTLTADAAAFYDKSFEDASSALNSFVNGSYEGGEAIGLFANDTQLAAFAVEQGIVQSTKAWAGLDEATKQATRLDFAQAMQESAGATGQAARESDSYANQMGNLKAAWEKFLAQIGNAGLLDAAIGALKQLAEWVSVAAEKVPELVAKFKEWAAEVNLVEILRAVVDALKIMAVIVGPIVIAIGLWTAAQWLLNAAMTANPIGAVIVLITALVAAFLYLWRNNEEFRDFLINAWETIRDTAIKVWNGIKEFFIELWDNITEGVKTAWNAISEFFTGLWETITGAIETAWNAIKDFFTTTFDLIKEIFTFAFEFYRDLIVTTNDKIKSAVETAWNTIKDFFSNTLNNIKDTFTNVWNAVKDFFTTTTGNIKDTATNVWNNIKDVTSNTWDAIKNAIRNPLETARDFVKDIIDKIKGFFDFTITWPKIPLPHFRISPGGWGVGDLLKGIIPSLGIDWYAKGGVLTEPTIFGSMNGRLMAGGEAGHEAIAPIAVLQRYIAEAVAAQRGKTDELLGDMLDVLKEYLPNVRGDVVLDNRIVGAISPSVNKNLGRETATRWRGAPVGVGAGLGW